MARKTYCCIDCNKPRTTTSVGRCRACHAKTREHKEYNPELDPSPDEIAAMCEEIRKNWDEDRLARSDTSPKTVPWVAPEMKVVNQDARNFLNTFNRDFARVGHLDKNYE